MSHKISQNTRSKYANSRHKRKRNLLPLWLALGGVTLVSLVFFAFWRGGSAPKTLIEVTGSPSLKADKEKVDLGEVKLGRTVQVSFEITNVGDQPLRFTQEPYIEVKAGC